MVKVSEQSAKEWCEDKGIPYMETSAKEDTNVRDAFRKIAEQGMTFSDEKNKNKTYEYVKNTNNNNNKNRKITNK
jgi:Ras family